MSLLDIFKKKDKFEFEDDPNTYLQLKLRRKLKEMGHKARLEDGSLNVDSKFKILTTIISHSDLHPYIMHLHTVIISKNYLPGRLTEDLVGVGKDTRSKVNSVLDNFLKVSLPPLLEAFGDCPQSEFDFEIRDKGKKILWHPILGEFGFQGKWEEPEYPEKNHLFNIIKESIKKHLVDSDLNWLKIYLAKQPDGTISGECLLNNNVWEDGHNMLIEYARTWETQSTLKAIKQFIFFRQCEPAMGR